ncbi:hypothetical protein C8R44DRAFT_828455 [Mycena epipterygia]|nr:hypothetical protein C8R44DRAFT_828455 [Mycena epipterygia]
MLTVAERNEILEWFSPLYFFLRQADLCHTRQPGTGGWLLEDALFKEWKSGNGKILLCRGMLVDNLRKTLESQDTGVAVIYLNHKETLNTIPLIFRKSISLAVHQLYETLHEPRTRPSLDDIHAVLCTTVAEYSKVFVVVDTLDEYPEEQRYILLHRLSALGPTVNLMLTSRPHINIHSIIADAEILEIKATEDDIRRYVDAQIFKSSRLSRHIKTRPVLREEIEAIIVRRSDGMWVSTVDD